MAPSSTDTKSQACRAHMLTSSSWAARSAVAGCLQNLSCDRCSLIQLEWPGFRQQTTMHQLPSLTHPDLQDTPAL